MKSVYTVSMFYKKYHVYFHFTDPLDAVMLKNSIEKERPDINVAIHNYKVIEKLTGGFMDAVIGIFKEIDEGEATGENLLAVPSEAG